MKTVFLDLDGTLTDPKEGITKSVIYALERVGIDAPQADDLEWVIGPALIDSFSELGVDDPNHAVALYRERYTDVGLFENRPYPGVLEVLGKLAKGYRLCLATAKPQAYATRITDKFGLNRHLFAEYGPELDGTRNDKGELLAYALSELGAHAEDCIMIGDRHHDIDAARAVGMRAIAVTWGYGSAEEHAKADAICTQMEDLPTLVQSMLG